MLVLELSLATKFGLQTKPVPPISISGSLSIPPTMHMWHVDKLNLQDGLSPVTAWTLPLNHLRNSSHVSLSMPKTFKCNGTLHAGIWILKMLRWWRTLCGCLDQFGCACHQEEQHHGSRKRGQREREDVVRNCHDCSAPSFIAISSCSHHHCSRI